MRFRLILRVDKNVWGMILPCNYLYPLSSTIYKILNEGNSEFAAWLHDHGYITGERKQFKLFTFSNLYIPRFQIFGDRMNILSEEVCLIVSFYPIDAIEAFVVGLFNNRHIVIGDKRTRVSFDVVSVERLPEPSFSETMRFRTISPVFIDEKREGGGTTRHVSPDEPVFLRLLEYNLLEKYRAFYRQEPLPEWHLDRLQVLSPPKAKTITIKEGTSQRTQLKSYLFGFEITGNPELLKLMYDSGAGRLGSQGFGCIEVWT